MKKKTEEAKASLAPVILRLYTHTHEDTNAKTLCQYLFTRVDSKFAYWFSRLLSFVYCHSTVCIRRPH